MDKTPRKKSVSKTGDHNKFHNSLKPRSQVSAGTGRGRSTERSVPVANKGAYVPKGKGPI